jgi:hypothetical protein
MNRPKSLPRIALLSARMMLPALAGEVGWAVSAKVCAAGFCGGGSSLQPATRCSC